VPARLNVPARKIEPARRLQPQYQAARFLPENLAPEGGSTSPLNCRIRSDTSKSESKRKPDPRPVARSAGHPHRFPLSARFRIQCRAHALVVEQADSPAPPSLDQSAGCGRLHHAAAGGHVASAHASLELGHISAGPASASARHCHWRRPHRCAPRRRSWHSQSGSAPAHSDSVRWARRVDIENAVSPPLVMSLLTNWASRQVHDFHASGIDMGAVRSRGTAACSVISVPVAANHGNVAF